MPATLSVGDVTIVEGNAGTQYAAVSVTLDAPSNKTVTVNYGTADGTATAGSDYGAVSGRLTFARGETSKTIAVPVYGDRLAEANETFVVNLSGARARRSPTARGSSPSSTTSRASASATWPAPSWLLGRRRHGHRHDAHFTVSLAAAYDQAVTVNYATADGTATAGVDYLATSGTLTFAPGETTKTITVEVIGNDSGLDEWFSVNLSGASGNVQIIDGQGVGTIHYYFEQPTDSGCGCTPDHPYYPNC